MKIKNILFIILSLNIQLNLKSQNADKLQKLKSAIDNYNANSVKQILKNNSNLIQARIDGKNLLDYALNVAENLRLIESEDDSLSLELEIENEDILNNLKNEVKTKNIYNIIEFLKSKRITSDLSDIAYNFRRLEVMPNGKSKEDSILIDFVNCLIYGPIDQAIDLALEIANNSKVMAMLNFEESKLLNIVNFFMSLKSDKLNNEFKNIDILKSILLGNTSINYNRETIEESLIWSVYNTAKEYDLKALGRFIKYKLLSLRIEEPPQELELSKLPKEVKDVEIFKFI